MYKRHNYKKCRWLFFKLKIISQQQFFLYVFSGSFCSNSIANCTQMLDTIYQPRIYQSVLQCTRSKRSSHEKSGKGRRVKRVLYIISLQSKQTKTSDTFNQFVIQLTDRRSIFTRLSIVCPWQPAIQCWRYAAMGCMGRNHPWSVHSLSKNIPFLKLGNLSIVSSQRLFLVLCTFCSQLISASCVSIYSTGCMWVYTVQVVCVWPAIYVSNPSRDQ